MSKMYAELDSRILDAIQQNNRCLYDRRVREEANRIAEAAGRNADRVIDGRVQALRKRGVIEYVYGKWYMTEPKITHRVILRTE